MTDNHVHEWRFSPSLRVYVCVCRGSMSVYEAEAMLNAAEQLSAEDARAAQQDIEAHRNDVGVVHIYGTELALLAYAKARGGE